MKEKKYIWLPEKGLVTSSRPLLFFMMSIETRFTVSFLRIFDNFSKYLFTRVFSLFFHENFFLYDSLSIEQLFYQT